MIEIAILLLLAIILGVFIFLIRYTIYIISKRTVDQYGLQFKAVEEIINQGKVPEDWLKKYRLKLEKIEESGGDEAKIQQVGQQAKRQFLKQLKHLHDRLKQGQFYDSIDTKIMVLETLREREQQWADKNWQDLFG